MVITLGSVGDIISVCLLVKDLVDTLDSSRGSSAEYRGLIRELWSLDRSLLQVDLLCRTYAESEEVIAICDTARGTVSQCHEALQELMQRVQRYDRHLKDKGSGNLLGDVAMKVRWQVSEKEAITKFRTAIATHSNALSMLLATANVKISQQNASKLNQLNNAAKADGEKSNSALIEVNTQLGRSSSRLSEIKTVVGRIADGFGWLQQVCSDIKDSLGKLLSVNIQTYNAVIRLHSGLTPRLEQPLIEEPFILEDAIGRRSPVHLQFINSWDALHAVLELRFRGIQGSGKIVKKEYALQDDPTGREILFSRPWECSFLPGQRVAMSFVFEHEVGSGGPSTDVSCPSCKHVCAESSVSDVHCPNCGLFYRRVIEIEEVESLPAAPKPAAWKVKPVFGCSSFPASFGPASQSRKRKAADLFQGEVMSFKRIRIISKQLQPRRHAFAPPSDVVQWPASTATPKATADLVLPNPGEMAFRTTGLDVFGNYDEDNDTNMLTNDEVVETNDVHLNAEPMASLLANIRSNLKGLETPVLSAIPLPECQPKFYDLNDFTLLRTIGIGSYARVRLTQSKQNQRYYAVKVLKCKEQVRLKQIEHTRNELRIWSCLSHPFIARCWGASSDPQSMYMFMDFYEGGEMFYLLRKSERFPNPVARFYAAEVLLALEYLHAYGILYRSIKPENIVLCRQGHVRLVDFGFAKVIKDRTYTLCGTADYLAPEILLGDTQTLATDWWTWAILVYEMLVGHSPFCREEEDSRPLKIYENIVRGKVVYPLYLQPDAKSLLGSILVQSPAERLCGLDGDATPIKKHDWFREVDWDKLLRKEYDAPYLPPVRAECGDTSQFDIYPEDGGRKDSICANLDSEAESYKHLFPDFYDCTGDAPLGNAESAMA